MLKIKKYSIGEGILLVVAGASLLPAITATLGLRQLPAISALFAVLYVGLACAAVKKIKILAGKSLVLIALLLWTVVMFLRGLKVDYEFFYSVLIVPYVFLPFTFPFVAATFREHHLHRLYQVIGALNIAYLIFVALNAQRLISGVEGGVAVVENVTHYLAFPNFLMLFSLYRVGILRRLVSISVYFVGLFASLYFARRGLTWTFACGGFLAISLLLFDSGLSVRRRMIWLFGFLGVVLAASYVLWENSQSLLGPLMDRLFEDSRGWVLKDFEQDMGALDLLFGRGIGGTYFLSVSDVEGVSGRARGIIESGYLNIILYGGYIYLGLLGLMYGRAIYRGIFRSHNSLAKALACFIIMHVLELYPAGVLFFNIQFLIIWIAIALCLDRNFIRSKNGLSLERSSNNRVLIPSGAMAADRTIRRF